MVRGVWVQRASPHVGGSAGALVCALVIASRGMCEIVFNMMATVRMMMMVAVATAARRLVGCW